ncbi:MAG: YqhA family protein [Flavisolibacter sp.]
MKQLFSVLRILISTIAVLVALAGVALTLIGIYEFAMAVTHVNAADKGHFVGLIATGLLKSVDTFVMVIVFFVFALGILILFQDPSRPFPINLPEWLRLKSFMQLKVILWEAILTTMVVSYVAMMAEKRMDQVPFNIYDLIIPGAVFLIALSLYFLKGKEH